MDNQNYLDVSTPESIEDQIEMLSDLIMEEQEAKAKYDTAHNKVQKFKDDLYRNLNKRLQNEY